MTVIRIQVADQGTCCFGPRQHANERRLRVSRETDSFTILGCPQFTPEPSVRASFLCLALHTRGGLLSFLFAPRFHRQPLNCLLHIHLASVSVTLFSKLLSETKLCRTPYLRRPQSKHRACSAARKRTFVIFQSRQSRAGPSTGVSAAAPRAFILKGGKVLMRYSRAILV